MKSFILNSSNVRRDSSIWNMIGSLVMSFQSVIFLMILTRTVSITESGIFTIAYANANLFLNIGKYGMRNFQVSDVNNDFSFREYLSSRHITTVIMVFLLILYTIYSAKSYNYSIEKSQIIIWMCLFKVSDSIEDVYYGDYQKKERLDIASKAMALRAIITIIIFGIIVVMTKNLLFTLIVSTTITSVLMIIFLKWTFPQFDDSIRVRKGYTLRLLKNCFPVFISAFLSFYIGNAPKYAIDSQLTDELQACYGFIAMPVFVVGLLNGFVFVPVMYRLSCMWNENKILAFLKNVFVQIVVVFLITIVCIVGAYICGIPVLSVLYNTDLSPYKIELLILLLGGGFLGLSGVLGAVIIIMRYQKALAFGYGGVSAVAFVVSNGIVKSYGIMGASALYTILMMLLCVFFLIIIIYGVVKTRRGY